MEKVYTTTVAPLSQSVVRPLCHRANEVYGVCDLPGKTREKGRPHNAEKAKIEGFYDGDIYSSLSCERQSLSTSDFQSEVGEVFGEIGGELPAKFRRRFSSFFCWGKSSEAFSTKTPPQILPSNFTTRFWVVAGPKSQLFCILLL